MNPLKIINYIRQNKLTKNEFCKICKIKMSTLDNIIYYGKLVDYSVLEQISKKLIIGVYELYTFDN